MHKTGRRSGVERYPKIRGEATLELLRWAGAGLEFAQVGDSGGIGAEELGDGARLEAFCLAEGREGRPNALRQDAAEVDD